MLTITELDVFHGRVHALRGVGLNVAKGEIVALIGANGAGKTTLLTAISGLLRPSAGNVRFDGADITRFSPEKIVRLGLSHVPERRLVFAPLSVEDNLVLGGYTRRSDKAGTARDMEAMFEMFPVLGQRRAQAAGTLSGGEQQMLAIARALMARPAMLLLDEPGMGLAPAVCKDIFRRIQDLQQHRQLTVLLVEQNAKSALKIADRAYVLETGRIVMQGPSEELLQDPRIQQAYLGAGHAEQNGASGRCAGA